MPSLEDRLDFAFFRINWRRYPPDMMRFFLVHFWGQKEALVQSYADDQLQPFAELVIGLVCERAYSDRPPVYPAYKIRALLLQFYSVPPEIVEQLEEHNAMAVWEVVWKALSHHSRLTRLIADLM